MKLSKKLIAGFSAMALLMTASVFTSCSDDESKSDNDLGIVQKDNSDKFTIDYQNETSSVLRGYELTKNKHSGALTQVTLYTSDVNCGAVGYIWDHEEVGKNYDGTYKDYSRVARDTHRRFCIAGLSYTTAGVRPYVSQYKDVTDIGLNNFGATAKTEKEEGSTATSTGAEETEFLKLGEKVLKPTENANYNSTTGEFIITIDVKEEKNGSAYTGGYIVNFYNGAYNENNLPATADATAEVKAANLGYTGQPAQHLCAAYANVYAKKTLKAKIQYIETYNADEVVE